MTFWFLLRDGLFIFAVVFIWLMLIYQFVLTIGGILFWRKEKLRGEAAEVARRDHWPTISVLIPAKNEALVIQWFAG